MGVLPVHSTAKVLPATEESGCETGWARRKDDLWQKARYFWGLIRIGGSDSVSATAVGGSCARDCIKSM